MSIFVAKEDSTHADQRLRFLQWFLSVATSIFKHGKDVEIMIDRPNKNRPLPSLRNFWAVSSLRICTLWKVMPPILEQYTEQCVTKDEINKTLDTRNSFYFCICIAYLQCVNYKFNVQNP